jgi:integrase
MQLSSLGSKAWRIAVGQRPRDRRQHHPAQERLTVVCLDRGVALVAGEPVARGGRVAPPGSRAAAEFAGHGGTVSDRTCVRVLASGYGARLEPITFHECTHTFASLLIDSGANPKAIQEHMGHSKIQTTFDTYGHLISQAKQKRPTLGGASLGYREERYM